VQQYGKLVLTYARVLERLRDPESAAFTAEASAVLGPAAVAEWKREQGEQEKTQQEYYSR
jgi:hypothetical protein